MHLLRTRQVDPVPQSPPTRMYGFFTHGTVPPSRLYSSGFLSLPDHLRRPPSPTHSGRRLLGHAVFAALQVSGRRRRTKLPSCSPPSAAHTARAVFPHAAFTKTQDEMPK